MSQKNFIESIKNELVHIVGVSGAEGSNILRFLVKNGVKNIYVHDYVAEDELEKSFKLWHKGISGFENEQLYKTFKNDLGKTRKCFGADYLKNIDKADVVFVPQSWRLYEERNSKLFSIDNKIPFYTITKVYLDLAPARIIGITGTVGKGSVGNLLYQILKTAGKKVYFTGNETWKTQLADKLDEMEKSDFLILEISHRQLMNGINKSPEMVIFTNLYPNHLDELSYEKYKQIKISLLEKQTKNDTAIVNNDSPDLIELIKNIDSNTLLYSAKNINQNTKVVQNIYKSVMNNKSTHYMDNILAASTAATILGINEQIIKMAVENAQPLPARMEYLGEIKGIKIYDDIKSTTPWSTLMALKRLGRNTVLICGGDSKGIDYSEFGKQIINFKKIVILHSKLSKEIQKHIPPEKIKEFSDLEKGFKYALSICGDGDNVLISPGAAFFYTKFIRNKKSVKKILISLLLKERV